MDAAFPLMSRGGLEGSSIADIARAAGLSVGTFYNHFPTREALAEAVVAHAADRHGAFLDWVASGETDPARALALRIRASVRRGAMLRDWGRFVIRWGLQSPALRETLAGREARAAQADPSRATAGEVEIATAAIVIAMLVLVEERQSDGEAEGEAAARAGLVLAGVDPQRAGTLARTTILPGLEG